MGKYIMDRVYNVEKSRKRIHHQIPLKSQRRNVADQRELILFLDILLSHSFVTSHKISSIFKLFLKNWKRKNQVQMFCLMKSTFYRRRKHILEINDSVFMKVDKFPALKIINLEC